MIAEGRRDDAGFTLLEVLIAGVIAALALAVLFQAGLSGLETVRQADRTEEAVSVAQSHLALGTAGPLSANDAQGADGPFHWHTHIAAIATTKPPEGTIDWLRHPGETQATLFRADVDVAWRDNGRVRHLILATKRIGFAPALAVIP